MENATKALLIAAAVLIAILLISLGVGVFNTASESMGDADLSEYEIQKFNEKFAQYNGNNKSGAEVNALMQTVFTHNNAQADASTCVQLLNGSTPVIAASTGITNMPPKESTGARYNIVVNYNAQTGLVESVSYAAVTTTP